MCIPFSKRSYIKETCEGSVRIQITWKSPYRDIKLLHDCIDIGLIFGSFFPYRHIDCKDARINSVGPCYEASTAIWTSRSSSAIHPGLFVTLYIEIGSGGRRKTGNDIRDEVRINCNVSI